MYLLEGLDGKTSDTRTVAPGCAGAMIGEADKDKQCNLKQFLKYIWWPRIGTKKFPVDSSDPTGPKESKTVYGLNGEDLVNTATGQPLSLDDALKSRDKLDDFDLSGLNGVRWEDKSRLARIYNVVFQAGYTDGAEASRLVRGTTTFAESRSKVTQALPAIAAKYPMLDNMNGKSEDYKVAAKMVQAAQGAVESAYKMRLMDYEKYRINKKSLVRRFQQLYRHGLNPTVRTTEVDTGLGFKFQTLDVAATLAANEHMTEAMVTGACQAQREGDPAHWVALEAAEASVHYGQCNAPTVTL